MRFYISGSWNRRAEFQEYARQLEELGYENAASWLKPNEYENRDTELTEDEQRGLAKKNLTDIYLSNLFIAFTEEEGSANTRGGRHVEFGIVMGLSFASSDHYDVALVGPVENLFYRATEQAGRFNNFAELLDFLKAYANAGEEPTPVVSGV